MVTCVAILMGDVFALQEPDNWNVTRKEVRGYLVYGCDHGKTAIVCSGPVCQVRRSWDRHERCPAVSIACMTILTVHIPALCVRRRELHRQAGRC